MGQVRLTSEPAPAPASEPGIDVGLPVDWALARRTAARLVAAGPPVSRDDAVGLVRRLRSDAAVAEGEALDRAAFSAELRTLGLQLEALTQEIETISPAFVEPGEYRARHAG